jgi:hypothetical protein
LLYFDKSTIILSYFFDLIQLEISGTNIVNDLSHSNSQSNSGIGNYPIQKIYLKSLVDRETGSVSLDNTPHSSNSIWHRKSKDNKVPIYVRYCIDLILKEMGEGDLMVNNNKYKYVKDLPRFIAHLGLSCKCASTLAQDFDFFAFKTLNTELICEFDFDKHQLELVLPSEEDYCYFKLILDVLPGQYYQQPITFKIENQDGTDDDIFKPNIKRLTKLLDGQYIEDGSFRKYLQKLNLKV